MLHSLLLLGLLGLAASHEVVAPRRAATPAALELVKAGDAKEIAVPGENGLLGTVCDDSGEGVCPVNRCEICGNYCGARGAAAAA